MNDAFEHGAPRPIYADRALEGGSTLVDQIEPDVGGAVRPAMLGGTRGGEIHRVLRHLYFHDVAVTGERLDGVAIAIARGKIHVAENIRRIGEVAKLFTDAGVIAITSFISPYKKDRDAVRASSKPGEFIEVYINVSLEAAEKRDPKGLYKKARAGQLKGFTGIDDPYEAPEKAEIVIDTETTSAGDAAAQILAHLEKGGYLHA